MITIYPRCGDIKSAKNNSFLENLNSIVGSEIFPFSCARAALVYGLRSLGVGRMEEILVPPYLGHCVLSSLAKSSFPSMNTSSITKAVLVFHQFGYIQKIKEIEKIAVKNNWIIVNNCSHAIFSSYKEEPILNWGDFSVVSFSKIFPCILGGGLISKKQELCNFFKDDYLKLFSSHFRRADMAYDILDKFQKGFLGKEVRFEVDSVFGYLPEVVSLPTKTLLTVGDSAEEIKNEIIHRKRLLEIVDKNMPGRTPECRDEEDIVPFAIPVMVDANRIEEATCAIYKELKVETPILNFDFARNIFNSDYRKCLVIGCHQGWTEEIVENICSIIRRYDS
ncbi:MAG: DegT/DnrJ/EryC1/StrS family aminotransferase [Candidatus Zapsychrus exili]|nr:DegT/DnrJ/EryC1/StrS family aminotransferase [Candidatus Zapsychrus exili]